MVVGALFIHFLYDSFTDCFFSYPKVDLRKIIPNYYLMCSTTSLDTIHLLSFDDRWQNLLDLDPWSIEEKLQLERLELVHLYRFYQQTLFLSWGYSFADWYYLYFHIDMNIILLEEARCGNLDYYYFKWLFSCREMLPNFPKH